MTWPAACAAEPCCLAHFALRPPGCVCPKYETAAGYHLTALDGTCPAHTPLVVDGARVTGQHVIFCGGCLRAWLDPPGDASCTCPPGFEGEWLIDPRAEIPDAAWAR